MLVVILMGLILIQGSCQGYCHGLKIHQPISFEGIHKGYFSVDFIGDRLSIFCIEGGLDENDSHSFSKGDFHQIHHLTGAGVPAANLNRQLFKVIGPRKYPQAV